MEIKNVVKLHEKKEEMGDTAKIKRKDLDGLNN